MSFQFVPDIAVHNLDILVRIHSHYICRYIPVVCKQESFSVVFLVLYDLLILVFLNSFVINFILLTTYVKDIHLLLFLIFLLILLSSCVLCLLIL